MARSAWTIVTASALLIGVSACTSRAPDFAIDFQSSSDGAEASAETFRSGTGASIYVFFASTPPPGAYRFVRLREDGRVDVREVLTVDGPGPWLTYEGVVSVPPATARAIVQATDASRLSSAPPPGSGSPCVLGLASTTALVWKGCADAALARRVLTEVPPLTPAALGTPCSRRLCEVRLVRSTATRGHERYGQVAQDIVINAGGAISCAAIPQDRSGAPNVLHVVRGRVRDADAGALFDWLAGAIPETAGPRAADDGLGGSGVVARGPGGVWTRVATPQATATGSRWGRIATRLPPACRLPQDWLTSSAAVLHQ